MKCVCSIVLAAATLVAVGAAGQVAQKPKPPARPPAAGASAVKPVDAPRPKVATAPAPKPPETYSYRAEGRRDPFVSLMNRGGDTRQNRKGDGIAGLYASEVVLRGIMQSRGTYLAIVQGPDGRRPYIVHTNDRFADGVVKAISADSMLILQEVNDPLSLTKQREIRKTLRAVEEVK
ncbi:MAG TPA: hypothetical protein VGK32_01730 [Vicinamibacterales bacterium]|jgi:Tfp pilus assembly protein PilP